MNLIDTDVFPDPIPPVNPTSSMGSQNTGLPGDRPGAGTDAVTRAVALTELGPITDPRSRLGRCATT